MFHCRILIQKSDKTLATSLTRHFKVWYQGPWCERPPSKRPKYQWRLVSVWKLIRFLSHTFPIWHEVFVDPGLHPSAIKCLLLCSSIVSYLDLYTLWRSCPVLLSHQKSTCSHTGAESWPVFSLLTDCLMTQSWRLYVWGNSLDPSKNTYEVFRPLTLVDGDEEKKRQEWSWTPSS